MIEVIILCRVIMGGSKSWIKIPRTENHISDISISRGTDERYK
jgi:hypothetical protein